MGVVVCMIKRALLRKDLTGEITLTSMMGISTREEAF